MVLTHRVVQVKKTTRMKKNEKNTRPHTPRCTWVEFVIMGEGKWRAYRASRGLECRHVRDTRTTYKVGTDTRHDKPGERKKIRNPFVFLTDKAIIVGTLLAILVHNHGFADGLSRPGTRSDAVNRRLRLPLLTDDSGNGDSPFAETSSSCLICRRYHL